jgi:hypothetical protein
LQDRGEGAIRRRRDLAAQCWAYQAAGFNAQDREETWGLWLVAEATQEGINWGAKIHTKQCERVRGGRIRHGKGDVYTTRSR